DHQLEGRRLVEEHWPGNRQLDVEAGMQGPLGFEADAAARKIDGAACARVEDTLAADELPFQIKLNQIAVVAAAVAGYRRQFGLLGLVVPLAHMQTTIIRAGLAHSQ